MDGVANLNQLYNMTITNDAEINLDMADPHASQTLVKPDDMQNASNVDDQLSVAGPAQPSSNDDAEDTRNQ